MNYSVFILHENMLTKSILIGILETEGYKTHDFPTVISETNKMNESIFPDVIVCDIDLLNSSQMKDLLEAKKSEVIPLVMISSQAEKGEENELGIVIKMPFIAEDILNAVSSQIKKKLNGQFISPKENISNLTDGVSKEFLPIHLLSKHTQFKRFEKNEKIYAEGDTHHFVYFISSGKVKISKLNSWGKEFIVEVLKVNDFFGYIAVLNGSNRNETAIALEDAKIGMIPQKDFLHLLYSNNQISLYITKYISSKLSMASEKALQLAYDSARKRVARALVYFTNIYSEGNHSSNGINLSRENISAISGISLETVSRTLTEFKQDGYIEVNNRNIKIIQHKKLELLKN